MEFPKIKAFDGVYEPREDSFLMAECVKRYAFGKTLDMGTGTGIQGIVAAANGCEVTFSDISETAIECARYNARLNGADGTFVESDMFLNLYGKFNTIIFNPPYIPTKSIKYIDTDGGPKGRVLVERFLASFSKYVERNGNVLLLESSLNDYKKDISVFDGKVVCSRSFDFEELVVILIRI